MVPEKKKESKSLAIFKDKIRTWRPIDCFCRICTTTIPDAGRGKFK